MEAIRQRQATEEVQVTYDLNAPISPRPTTTGPVSVETSYRPPVTGTIHMEASPRSPTTGPASTGPVSTETSSLPTTTGVTTTGAKSSEKSFTNPAFEQDDDSVAPFSAPPNRSSSRCRDN